MSAGRRASGSMPAWLTSSSRRGDPEANTNLGRPITVFCSCRAAAVARSLESVRDATLGEVVWRHLYQHLVAGKHADAVLAHASCGVGDDFMLVLEFDAEGRIRQQLRHDAGKFQKFFFRHSVSGCWNWPHSAEICAEPSGCGPALQLSFARYEQCPSPTLPPRQATAVSRADHRPRSFVASALIAEALFNPRQQQITHFTICVKLLVARSLDAARIGGRPIFDIHCACAGEFKSPVMRFRRQSDDEIKIQPLPIVQLLDG